MVSIWSASGHNFKLVIETDRATWNIWLWTPIFGPTNFTQLIKCLFHGVAIFLHWNMINFFFFLMKYVYQLSTGFCSFESEFWPKLMGFDDVPPLSCTTTTLPDMFLHNLCTIFDTIFWKISFNFQYPDFGASKLATRELKSKVKNKIKR